MARGKAISTFKAGTFRVPVNGLEGKNLSLPRWPNWLGKVGKAEWFGWKVAKAIP